MGSQAADPQSLALQSRAIRSHQGALSEPVPLGLVMRHEAHWQALVVARHAAGQNLSAAVEVPVRGETWKARQDISDQLHRVKGDMDLANLNLVRPPPRKGNVLLTDRKSVANIDERECECILGDRARVPAKDPRSWRQQL